MSNKTTIYVPEKLLICFCFLALCIQLCYPASGWSHPRTFAAPEMRVDAVAEWTVQLSGIEDLADVLSFRDLLQGSPLVKEVRPQRLTWTAGHPELGQARWSVQLSTDNPDALEDELLARARTQQLGGDDLRLVMRQSRRGLIEFALEKVPVDDSTEERLPAVHARSRALRSGQGFD